MPQKTWICSITNPSKAKTPISTPSTFNALGKVSPEAKKAFFQWLVDRGNGMWKDPSQEVFLVLWKTIPQWSETIVQWVHDFGLEDSVMTVDEIAHGEETAGSELEGLDREIIIHAIRELEKKGKAKLFQGSSQDDIGIKFFK